MSSLLSKFNKTKEQFRWLNYDICSDVEELCNGKIVAELLWTDFLCWFNLSTTHEEVKPLDKRKVEYLVHTLADYVDTDKDVITYADTTIYPKWQKLDEEGKILKLISLSKQDRMSVLKETWEKKVVEAANITFKEHKKHRDEVKQTNFYDNYRSQSKKNVNFIEDLDEILSKYPKFELDDD